MIVEVKKGSRVEGQNSILYGSKCCTRTLVPILKILKTTNKMSFLGVEMLGHMDVAGAFKASTHVETANSSKKRPRWNQADQRYSLLVGQPVGFRQRKVPAWPFCQSQLTTADIQSWTVGSAGSPLRPHPQLVVGQFFQAWSAWAELSMNSQVEPQHE